MTSFSNRIERLTDNQRAALVRALGQYVEQAHSTPATDVDQLWAYVVPEDGIDLQGLRPYLAERLPDHLVPARFVTLDALPRSPNGKIDRRRLPILKSPSSATSSSPRNEVEFALAAVWCEVLGLHRVSIHDNYFALGGDSLTLIRLVVRCQQAGITVTPGQLYENPTIAGLASVILSEPNQMPAESAATLTVESEVDRVAPERVAHQRPVLPEANEAGKAVRLSSFVDKPNLFLVPAKGHYFDNFRHLAAEITEYTCYSPYSPENDSVDRLKVEDMLPDFLSQIRSVQPSGPYRLAGFCEGAYIAWDIARQLTEKGEEIRFLGIIDTPNPARLKPIPETFRAGMRRRFAAIKTKNVFGFSAQVVIRTVDWFRRRVRQLFTKELHLTRIGTRMGWLYRPQPYPGHATLFRIVHKSDDALYQSDVAHGWGELPDEGLDICSIPGQRNEAETIDNFLSPPHATVLAKRMQLAIRMREQASAK